MKIACALALPLFLVACAGKPIDPLAEDRARLLALDDEPLPEGWQPQAAVLVGPGLLRAQLQAAVDDATAEAHATPPVRTPVGPARLTPRATVGEVSFAPSAACSGCLEVGVDATGELRAQVETPLGPFGHELSFAARALTTTALALSREDGSTQVRLRPAQEGDWDVAVQAEGAPPEVNEMLSAALAERLERALSAGLVPELPLVELPDDGVARLRGVRATPASLEGGQGGVAVELAFSVLEAEAVTTSADPEDGFVVVVPMGTLLGLARAAALRAEPVDGHVAEPLAIELEDDRFLLEVRVWRLAAKPTSRDFCVTGRVVVQDGEVRVVPDKAEDRGDFTLDPVEHVVRSAMLARLQEGLAAMVPAHLEQELILGRRAAIDVERITGEGGALLLYGRASLLRPPGDAS